MMPRRLDGSGNMVVTPGLGFEYIDKESGFLFVSALIKDCYDNLAGTILLGKSMNLGKFAKLGLTLGVYARETPMICQAKQVFGTTTNTRCVIFQNSTVIKIVKCSI